MRERVEVPLGNKVQLRSKEDHRGCEVRQRGTWKRKLMDHNLCMCFSNPREVTEEFNEASRDASSLTQWIISGFLASNSTTPWRANRPHIHVLVTYVRMLNVSYKMDVLPSSKHTANQKTTPRTCAPPFSVMRLPAALTIGVRVAAGLLVIFAAVSASVRMSIRHPQHSKNHAPKLDWDHLPVVTKVCDPSGDRLSSAPKVFGAQILIAVPSSTGPPLHPDSVPSLQSKNGVKAK